LNVNATSYSQAQNLMPIVEAHLMHDAHPLATLKTKCL